MPGIFGYVDFLRETSERLLPAMASALVSGGSALHSEFFRNHHLGIGRASLRVLNPEPQPVWNRDKNLCLVMEGEVYNRTELQRELGPECPPAESSDSELMVALYERFGEKFPAKVNGAYVAAIWDMKERTLRVINDHLGLYPVYYATVRRHFLFASGVRALLVDRDLPKATDMLAVAQFLTFDHMLDDRTMLESVRLMPQATILCFSRSGLQLRSYADLKYPETWSYRPEAELRHELLERLAAAVNRQVLGGQKTGLLLSGGLDSRILLGFLHEASLQHPLQTFTWGIPKCDEARIAKELSRVAKASHHFFELEPDYLLRKANEAVRLTDGNGNLINLHVFAILEQVAEHVQVLYKGFLGDAMFGFALQRPFWADYAPEQVKAVHLSVHSNQGVLNFTRQNLRELLLESVDRRVGDAVFDSYRSGMLRSGSPQLSIQRLYFDLTQRVPRMTLNGVEVARARTAVRLPFADRELLDFSLTIPPGFHFERYLVRSLLPHAFPKLARVPMSDTGLPMVSCARELELRALKIVRWHLRRTGFSWLDWPDRRPYKNYGSWFRSILKPWILETILTPNALERGYFRPAYIKRIVEEHMSGASDHTVKLGALLTIETWHRQFAD